MRLRAAVALFLLASACGGGGSGSGTTATPSTDASGNPIAEGDDWSAVGSRQREGRTTRVAEDEMAHDPSDPSASAPPGCVTTTLPAGYEETAPPGFDPNAPLEQPANDFPLTASISPEKGDRGAEVEVAAVAVGKPGALVVMVAQFSDRQSHGMRAAKFADAVGRAVFVGPVPETAPLGFAKIAVSASTEEDESAVTTLDFTVTGPGCPGA